ncbi:hypothetical protein [Paenibacillus sp. GCM10028914]|uniref:hypothetical protein n=1 Tax=Paenibacillus sp. GCM10028914 TaxID=3273416 RepID=UPI0036245C7B
MKKSYSNAFMFFSVILNVVLLVIVINQNFNVFGSKDKISDTYYSFYQSVKTLDRSLDQIDESIEIKKINENMYSANMRLNFVYDRYLVLEDSVGEHTRLDFPDVKVKLSYLKYGYESFMLGQLLKSDEYSSEAFKEFRKEIKDFSGNLPEEYNNSKEFVQKFNEAIKSLYLIQPI